MNQENEKLSKRDWSLISVAAIASYLDAALLVSTGVALSIWAGYFHMSPWLAGILSTMLTISVAVGSYVGGNLSDRFGRVRVFNLDILLVGIGTAIITFAYNIPTLLIGLAIAGLASGADLPTSLAVISERIPQQHHGRAISSTEIFWFLGIMISQGIGFVTAKMGIIGPRTMFAWLTIVAVATWAVRAFSKKFKQIEDQLLAENQASSGNGNEEQKKVKLSTLLKNPHYLMPLILLTVFYLFWNLPANTWGSFLNYFMVVVNHQSQSTATLIGFVTNIVAVIILYSIYMRFADTKYRYVMMHIGLGLSLVSFVISAFLGRLWVIFAICYFVYSVCNVLDGESIYKIWTQSFYPADVRATMTGYSYAIVRAFTAVFSIFTPVIMNFSPDLLMWLLAGSLAICWLSAIMLTRLVKGYGLSDPVYNPVSTTIEENSNTVK